MNSECIDLDHQEAKLVFTGVKSLSLFTYNSLKFCLKKTQSVSSIFISVKVISHQMICMILSRSVSCTQLLCPSLEDKSDKCNLRHTLEVSDNIYISF